MERLLLVFASGREAGDGAASCVEYKRGWGCEGNWCHELSLEFPFGTNLIVNGHSGFRIR